MKKTITLIAVLIAIGAAGIYIWQARKNTSTTTTAKSSSPTAKSNDATEGGRYLVITEWGVRVSAPLGMTGKLSYKLYSGTDPETGLALQGAEIYISPSALSQQSCATTETSNGTSIVTGAQYIRSDNSKPFNAARYKTTFKANILTDKTYSYHLNYATPDCINGPINAPKIDELDSALVNLLKI